jgi:hypothetical protein
MPPNPPPAQAEVAWRRMVEAHLRGDSAGQLVPSNVYGFSPIGGSGPPSSMWLIPVTTAAFDGSVATRPWICQLDRLTTLALRVAVPWVTDAATTGEVRLTLPALGGFPTAGNSPTAAVTLGAGSSGLVSFAWVLEARRTGGSGNVNIGYPGTGAVQCQPAGCTAAGQ